MVDLMRPQEFMERVQVVWDATWKDAYGPDPSKTNGEQGCFLIWLEMFQCFKMLVPFDLL